MYNNIGGKIKGLAAVMGWLCLIAGVIVWMVFIGSRYSSALAWYGLLGGALGFVSSWPLYGFGQLVGDIREMKENSASKSSSELPKL